ncbi:hypothetical protein ECB98_22615 [Brucellaceae bacterium VT-16-1752]|nr:hypothetical protein ECB98_22615 [Brucellaceae bacterium VT-16-1752]
MRLRSDIAVWLISMIGGTAVAFAIFFLAYGHGYSDSVKENNARIDILLENADVCQEKKADCIKLSPLEYLNAKKGETELSISKRNEGISYISLLFSSLSAASLLATAIFANQISNRSANAAEISAAAANRFGIAQTRAYITPVLIEILTETRNNHVRFCLTLRNSGNTPTTSIEIDAHVHLISDGCLFEEFETFHFPNLGSREMERKERCFPKFTERREELAKAVQSKKMSGYVDVIIRYRGIFDELAPEVQKVHFKFYGDVTDSILRAAPDHDDRS